MTSLNKTLIMVTRTCTRKGEKHSAMFTPAEVDNLDLESSNGVIMTISREDAKVYYAYCRQKLSAMKINVTIKSASGDEQGRVMTLKEIWDYSVPEGYSMSMSTEDRIAYAEWCNMSPSPGMISSSDEHNCRCCIY